MSGIVNILKRPWFLALLGVLALSLVVWFLGPYLAFADYKPFESVVGRLIAIIVILLAWGLIIQLRQLKSSRASQQLVQDMSSQQDAPAVGDAAAARAGASQDAPVLRRRFEEAVAALNKQNKRGGLYALPWYIIIGPPGSGKTTALLNSGLRFPLAEGAGDGRNAAVIGGVGGTRNCDWLFTDDAVLVDTAGRYTTQDSNQLADGRGWLEFLSLLRRHRKRRPINGALLTISVADLMSLSESERKQHARAMRDRLEELHKQLGIRFPVYVLLTKADLIAGFNEYFDDFDASAREQVWGVTFPYEQGAAAPLKSLPVEYDLLVSRLGEHVGRRMTQERDLGRRASIYGFPQQVAGLKPLLSGMLEDVFGGMGDAAGVSLRGVYFTSGTQLGTPIDRMMHSMARTFGLGLQAGPGSSGPGKAFFIHRLLKEVIFKEAGLAGVNRRQEMQRALMQSGAYIGIAVLTVLGLVWLTVSYKRNTNYLGEVAQVAEAVNAGRDATMASTARVETAVPWLDGLALVLGTARKPQEAGASLSMRAGLYQGRSMSRAANQAYLRQLNTSLGPAAAKHFEQRLASAAAAPDELYELLKMYLMLGEPARLDSQQMRLMTHSQWQQLFAGDTALAAAVAMHFDALIEDPKQVQAVSLDQNLIDAARASIDVASIPQLMYGRLKLAYGADDARSVNLATALGMGREGVLVRRSDPEFAQPLPALYTREVFDEYNSTGRATLTRQFGEELWVLGERAPPLTQIVQLGYQVDGIYEQDYIRVWDALLADIAVRPVRSQSELADVLTVLSSAASPMKSLVNLTARHTNLTAKDPQQGALAQAAEDRAAALMAKGGALIGAQPAVQPGSRVTEHFRALHTLAESPAALDQTLARLGEMAGKVRAAAGGAGGGAVIADAMAAQDIAAAAGTLPAPLGDMIGSVVTQSRSAMQSVAAGDLSQRYQSAVVRQCEELIGGRYPFVPGSNRYVPVADFGQVFGHGGIYDAFFQAELQPYVDTSRERWTWRSSAPPLAGAANMLAKFQAAERIRQVFFRPGSQTPEVRFTLTAQSLDAGATRFTLTLDGTSLEYRHDQPRPVAFTWPAAAPGRTAYAFEVAGGAGPNMAFEGPWAVLRLLEQAQVQASSDVQYLYTFSAGGLQARVQLQAQSVRNPFGPANPLRFSCSG